MGKLGLGGLDSGMEKLQFPAPSKINVFSYAVRQDCGVTVHS